MPTVDDLKRKRDGHDGYGPREWEDGYLARRFRPAPGSMIWEIERGEDGMPVRMYWCGRVPETPNGETDDG